MLDNASKYLDAWRVWPTHRSLQKTQTGNQWNDVTFNSVITHLTNSMRVKALQINKWHANTGENTYNKTESDMSENTHDMA